MNDARSAALSLSVETERWPLKVPFRITGHTFHELEVLVVTLSDGRASGRGEAAGVYYRQDAPAKMAAQIEAVRERIEASADRADLARLLGPGGARNALDCALWDLEAKLAGRPAWSLAGLVQPRPLQTTYTLGVDAPDAMAAGAIAFAEARAIKLKLIGDDDDAERVRRVRVARPDVWLAVDANQGFTRDSLAKLMPVLVEAGVALLEQPFPLERDAWLDGLNSPIPIAADESVQDLADIAGLADRVQVINIKLDKCGGLTEGLAMAREAQRLGLQVMVGNMLGTVLGMAPAFLLGQLCGVVDLDGPMPLAADRNPPIVYREGNVWCPPEIWGDPLAGAIDLGASA